MVLVALAAVRTNLVVRRYGGHAIGGRAAVRTACQVSSGAIACLTDEHAIAADSCQEAPRRTCLQAQLDRGVAPGHASVGRERPMPLSIARSAFSQAKDDVAGLHSFSRVITLRATAA